MKTLSADLPARKIIFENQQNLIIPSVAMEFQKLFSRGKVRRERSHRTLTLVHGHCSSTFSTNNNRARVIYHQGHYLLVALPADEPRYAIY